MILNRKPQNPLYTENGVQKWLTIGYKIGYQGQ